MTKDLPAMNFGQWIGFAILLICLYILWQIRQILLLLFMAIILANTLNIFVQWLKSLGLKRGLAVLIAVSLLLIGLIGAFWLIIPSFFSQFQQLVQLVPQGIQKLNTRIDKLISYLDPSLRRSLPDLDELIAQLQPILNQVAGRGLSVFYNSLGILLSFLLLFALTLMFLGNPSPYRQGFIRLFPAFYRQRVDEILRQCDRALRGWLKGIVFHMGIMTILSLTGLLLLGIPLAFAQAILAGILTFIPNLGLILSMIPPIAIALLESYWKPWVVLFLYIGIYLLIQRLDRTPPISALTVRSIKLLPGFVLLAQIFFASLFGFLGLFLAVPLLIVSQIWFQEAIVKDVLNHWHLSSKGERGRGDEGERG